MGENLSFLQNHNILIQVILQTCHTSTIHLKIKRNMWERMLSGRNKRINIKDDCNNHFIHALFTFIYNSYITKG